MLLTCTEKKTKNLKIENARYQLENSQYILNISLCIPNAIMFYTISCIYGNLFKSYAKNQILSITENMIKYTY